jgi:hypothetical protein
VSLESKKKAKENKQSCQSRISKQIFQDKVSNVIKIKYN